MRGILRSVMIAAPVCAFVTLLLLLACRPALACSCASQPIHAFVGGGESVDQGSDSTPVIHANVSYPVLSEMLACTNITSCGYNAVNSTDFNLNPSLISGLTDGFEQVSETSSSGLANRLQSYSYGYRDVYFHGGFGDRPTYADQSRSNSSYNITSCRDTNGNVILTGNPTVSTSWCNKFVYIVSVIQYAVASGTYADVPAETYTGGEVDTEDGETTAQAAIDMETEQSEFCSDLKQVETSYEPSHVQSNCPVLLIDQITSNWVTGVATSNVAIGQWLATQADPNQIAISVPKYPLWYRPSPIDEHHLSGIGENDLGEYQAQALQSLVRGSGAWSGFSPTAAHLVDSTHIHMPCNVPTPPILIDTNWFNSPSTAAPGYGLTLLYTANGAPSPPTITATSIASSGTEIDFSLSGTVDLTQSPVIQIAPATGTEGSGCTGTGSGTCLGTGTAFHDSSTLTPLVDYSLCTASGVPWGCCTSSGHGANCETGVHLYNPLQIFSIAVTS